MEYEPVIGLEVHTQLKTRTKIFCGCSTQFGNPPNTQVCPICLGFPGVLPVMNEEVIALAIKTCLMLGFTIPPVNKMDRKNYFYPDLPKNYQISQFDQPIGINGSLTISLNGKHKKIGITRVHMEEDAGKLMHGSEGESFVDFNRTGVPLLEIVSEPEMLSSEEAYLYLKKLKQILEYADISDCNMEEGSLRCDANVSVRPVGQKTLGTKTEIKNVNSFKFVQKAIDYEIERQISILKEGGKIVQETRLYDSNSGKTRSMRSKEEAHDYRYFPEPDLVPFMISEETIANTKKILPEGPDEKIGRFQTQYSLPEYDAEVLTASLGLATYFETCATLFSNYKMISNWMMSEMIREMNNRNVTIEKFSLTPDNFVSLLKAIDSGLISGKIAKDVFPVMIETGKNASQIIEEKGLQVMSDETELAKIIQNVVSSNPKTVEEFKNGKEKAFGFFVGQVMKATKGKADPKKVNEILRRELT